MAIRLYGCTFVRMKTKIKELRVGRAYKISDKPYLKAMKRASKNKEALATLIEEWVCQYANGADFVNLTQKIEPSPDVDFELLRKDYMRFISTYYRPVYKSNKVK